MPAGGTAREQSRGSGASPLDRLSRPPLTAPLAASSSPHQALQLLDHLIKNGTERVVEDARDHMFHIRTLTDFQYRDENGTDRGAGVRHKSREIIELLGDNAQIRKEREKARELRGRFGGTAGGSGVGNVGVGSGGGIGSMGGPGMDPYTDFSGGGRSGAATFHDHDPRRERRYSDASPTGPPSTDISMRGRGRGRSRVDEDEMDGAAAAAPAESAAGKKKKGKKAGKKAGKKGARRVRDGQQRPR